MSDRIFRPALGVLRRLGVEALVRFAVARSATRPNLNDRAHREAVARRVCVQTPHSLDDVRAMVEMVAHVDPAASEAYLLGVALSAARWNVSPLFFARHGLGIPAIAPGGYHA